MLLLEYWGIWMLCLRVLSSRVLGSLDTIIDLGQPKSVAPDPGKSRILI